MSKEGIKEKISDLRELLRGLITLIIALLSAEVILVFQILNGIIAVFNMVVVVGLILLFLLLMWGKLLWNTLDEYERRL